MTRSSGFTLVELMIVVAIIAVLTMVAMTAYRKYADKARASEVYALFGEIRSKEEAYRAETSTYCNTSTSCATTANEDTGIYPALLPSGEPHAKLIGTAYAQPAGWTALGISAGKSALYCGYVAVAGTAANFASAGARGAALWSTSGAPTGPWWYMSAACDNDGQSAVNTKYTSGVNTTTVVVAYEGN